MNKCKWENGHFFGCEKMNPGTRGDLDGNYYPICRSCNEDIRKPENPIAKRSGETWVGRYDGIDYLCINPESSRDYKMHPFDFSASVRWKQINGIELNDNIAKLRPMVVNNGNLGKLIAVDGRYDFTCIVITEVMTLRHWECHLANVDDLP